MKCFFLLFVSIGLLTVNLPAAAPPADTVKRFHKIASDFLYGGLALSPVSATQVGYHKHTDPKTGKVLRLDEMLDDLSPAGIQAQRKFYETTKRKLAQLDPGRLPLEDRADYDLILDQIELALAELNIFQSYRHMPQVYAELVGNAIFNPLVLEYAPLETRLGHVLARLERLPELYAQAKQNLVDTCDVWTRVAVEENSGNVGLVKDFVKSLLPKGSPLEARYNEVAPKALAAIEDYSAWVKNELSKRSTGNLRLGKEKYDLKFRYVIGVKTTPEEVLADAEQALRDTRRRMLELAEPLYKEWFPDRPAGEFATTQEHENAIIRAVLDRIAEEHSARDQLKPQAARDLAEVKEFVREKNLVALPPRDNLQIIDTPEFMRGIYGVAGFNSAPPLEPQLGAFYWITPVPPAWTKEKVESKLREYNLYKMKDITIHEAVPGHYVQLEAANRIQPVLRRLIRTVLGNGPYIEGWAVYTEKLFVENGYHGVKFELTYLKGELRMFANAILDIRLHTMNMTDQEALDLMIKDTFQERAEAEGKLQRAQLSSCQLPTYFVGWREWLKLRDEYRKTAGKKFSLRAFHDAALDEGSLPMPILKRVLLAKLGKTESAPAPGQEKTRKRGH